MYVPLPYVVKEVFAETYKMCGWNVRENKRGRPITLEDFRAQSEDRLAKARIRAEGRDGHRGCSQDQDHKSFSCGERVQCSTHSPPSLWTTLLRRPTVIELKDIQNNEEKAFVAALLLIGIAEYIEKKGNSKQLRHLTLIEEAHRLLPNISSQKGDPESADPRKRMVEQFANMLAEVRAFGEGLAIVEQIPTKIIPDAIKNTATKVAHRVPGADDREVLAGAMNLTKAQGAVFTALKPGEAIVSVEKHPLPIRVQAPNVIERMGFPFWRDPRRRGQTAYGRVLPSESASQAARKHPQPEDNGHRRRRVVPTEVSWSLHGMVAHWGHQAAGGVPVERCSELLCGGGRYSPSSFEDT